MQRLRVRFSRGNELKFISHLDIMRLWQRALIRAGISIAYSEGFSPHPKMSLAVPLALGVTSDAELMDIVLEKPLTPHAFSAMLSRQLPAGASIMQVSQVPPTLPSLQSQVRFAEYRVEVETDKEQQAVEAALTGFLALKEFPWEHQRDTGPRRYDLRALVDDLWLIDCRKGMCTIGMLLRSDSAGSGRPEQVAKALGFEQYPLSIHRAKLVLGLQ